MLVQCSFPNCLKKIAVNTSENIRVLCASHSQEIERLNKTITELDDEILSHKGSIQSLKKEIKVLQADRTRLITERDDKVYLVKDKLATWIKLLKKID